MCVMHQGGQKRYPKHDLSLYLLKHLWREKETFLFTALSHTVKALVVVVV